uniref:KIB1-4 beta-propeller domain-containing protein n=1 Tax=Brassica campestris TaxID=3711 RepID=M4E1S7_BRACM
MSLLLRRLGKLCHGKPAGAVIKRSSLLLSSNSNSSSSLLQTPPCFVLTVAPCGEDLGKLVIIKANEFFTGLGLEDCFIQTTLKDGGIVRLQDDLNPFASDTNPKRIPLPPLVTLPRCQTQMVTNMAMSSSSPEDEDCVVSLKFFGPQLSFCRPGETRHVSHSRVWWIPYWIVGCPHSTGETFLVKLYRRPWASGSEKMQTKALMVFKIDDEGNAVYTQDIGDLCIFISKSEPFCVPASSFPGMTSNRVDFLDFDENVCISVPDSNIIGGNCPYLAPYHIPPQTIV